jgi:hypothetical protein
MKTIVITESQLKVIVEMEKMVSDKDITQFNSDNLNEEYEPEKLYSLEYLESAMRSAPKYLKKYINKTNFIERDGKKFVRIPQVIYQYLTGNF